MSKFLRNSILILIFGHLLVFTGAMMKIQGIDISSTLLFTGTALSGIGLIAVAIGLLRMSTK